MSFYSLCARHRPPAANDAGPSRRSRNKYRPTCGKALRDLRAMSIASPYHFTLKNAISKSYSRYVILPMVKPAF